jgi:putative addiction module killer protein
MTVIREYLDDRQRSPFNKVFAKIRDERAAAKIVMAIQRISDGNTSGCEAVGEGVHERKIDYGPGYRVYFGWDGSALVILLACGDKKSQRNDIKNAKTYWRDYKLRKASGTWH